MPTSPPSPARMLFRTACGLTGAAALALAPALAIVGSPAATALASDRPSAPASPTSPATVSAGSSGTSGRSSGSGAQVWVDPSRGSDSASGAQGSPYRTIQHALDGARPGTTIHLDPGVYHESPATKVDGTQQAPITIEGPETGTDVAGRYRAVVRGTGHIVSIRNSDYVLRGFTVDGQEAVEAHVPLAKWPTSVSAALAFKRSVTSYAVNSRLVYIDGGPSGPAVSGTVIDDMFLSGSGGECVRLREGTTHTLIQDSVVQWCGVYPSKSKTRGVPYHNGEGVYIGTSPKSTDLSMHDDDPTTANVVRDSVIRTYGSECVDIKEHASDNVVTGVDCSGDTEAAADLGSTLEVRGAGNAVVANTVHDSLGYGVKVVSDLSASASGANAVVGNTLSGLAASALLVKDPSGQRLLCANTAGSGAPKGSNPAAWFAGCSSSSSAGAMRQLADVAAGAAWPTWPARSPLSGASSSPAPDPSASASASPSSTGATSDDSASPTDSATDDDVDGSSSSSSSSSGSSATSSAGDGSSDDPSDGSSDDATSPSGGSSTPTGSPTGAWTLGSATSSPPSSGSGGHHHRHLWQWWPWWSSPRSTPAPSATATASSDHTRASSDDD